MNNFKLIKADIEFVKELEEIKKEKMKLGTWKSKMRNRPCSDRRLTKAIRKLSYWESHIKKDLIEIPIEDDING